MESVGDFPANHHIGPVFGYLVEKEIGGVGNHAPHGFLIRSIPTRTARIALSTNACLIRARPAIQCRVTLAFRLAH